jgi:uncharacterized protein (TIGR00369 family)
MGPENSRSVPADMMGEDDMPSLYLPPTAGGPPGAIARWMENLPMSRHLKITCQALDRAGGTFTVPEAPLTVNPNGAVHGGLVAAIADHCLGAVAVMNSPRDGLAVTASLHGQFHRPAMPALTVQARLISAGRSLIYVECAIFDRKGSRAATFQATMSVGGAGLRRSVPAEAESTEAGS